MTNSEHKILRSILELLFKKDLDVLTNPDKLIKRQTMLSTARHIRNIVDDEVNKQWGELNDND